MKLVSKCGEMVIDIPEDLDYGNTDVKNMVEGLQKALDNIAESGYFLHPSDLGNLTFNKETEELWKLPPREQDLGD